MPADPNVYHKSCIPKVMFPAVTACLRPEYNFNGKVGIWPFTVTRATKRSNKRTGTVAGQTQVLELVNVDAAQYRNAMTWKDGVFAAIHAKMWWFKQSSGKPEAGCPIYYQYDGAHLHIAKSNERHWTTHGAMKGFDILVSVQPAQSPDFNCNDLAFFASLQKDTELVAKENVFDLEHCWQDYPSEKMESVLDVLLHHSKALYPLMATTRTATIQAAVLLIVPPDIQETAMTKLFRWPTFAVPRKSVKRLRKLSNKMAKVAGFLVARAVMRSDEPVPHFQNTLCTYYILM